jgi:hypothetical protein
MPVRYSVCTGGRKAEAKKVVVEGFLGPKPYKNEKGKTVTCRLRGLEIALTYVREFDNDFGTTTKMVGTAPSGHVVEWWATGTFGVEAGDVVTVDASVKDNRPANADQYTKVDTTVLTRGTIIKVVDPETGEEPDYEARR